MYNLWLLVYLEVFFAGRLVALENAHPRVESVETTTLMLQDFASESFAEVLRARNDVAWKEQVIEPTEDYETYVRQDSELQSDTSDSGTSGTAYENSALKREPLVSAQSNSEPISSTLMEDDITTVESTDSKETKVTPTQSDPSTELLINTDASEIVPAPLSESQTFPAPTDAFDLTSSEHSPGIQSAPAGQAMLPAETLEETWVPETFDTTESAARETSTISTPPEVEEENASSVPLDEGTSLSSEGALTFSTASSMELFGTLPSDAPSANANPSSMAVNQNISVEADVEVGSEPASFVTRSTLNAEDAAGSPSSTESKVEKSTPDFFTSKTPDLAAASTQVGVYPWKPKFPWNSRRFHDQRISNVRIEKGRPCVTPSLGFRLGRDPLLFKRILLKKTFNAITVPLAIKMFGLANFLPFRPLLSMKARIFPDAQRMFI